MLCDCESLHKKGDEEMRRFVLLTLLIPILACSTQTPTPQWANPPLATAMPTLTATPILAVSVGTVYVRSQPDGAVIGHLIIGQVVTVSGWRGDWARIDGGWVYAGCLRMRRGLGCR